MTSFSDIVAAADGLSVDEQQTLLEILRHRIAERNRERLAREVEEARQEFVSGTARPTSVNELMDEVTGES